MSGDVRRCPASIAINKMRHADDVQKAEGLTPGGKYGGAGRIAMPALSPGPAIATKGPTIGYADARRPAVTTARGDKASM